MDLDMPVAVALPRGGVPVAAEVARAPSAPLDPLLVRKVGAPQQPELATAAVVDGPQLTLKFDEKTLSLSGATRDHVLAHLPRHLAEIERHRHLYMPGWVPTDLLARTVIWRGGRGADAPVAPLRRRSDGLGTAAPPPRSDALSRFRRVPAPNSGFTALLPHDRAEACRLNLAKGQDSDLQACHAPKHDPTSFVKADSCDSGR
nr:hypothetical protein [Mitsuaria sp. WAJ17]